MNDETKRHLENLREAFGQIENGEYISAEDFWRELDRETKRDSEIASKIMSLLEGGEGVFVVNFESDGQAVLRCRDGVWQFDHSVGDLAVRRFVEGCYQRDVRM